MTPTPPFARTILPSVAVIADETCCTACGHVLGPASEPWKSYAVMREVPLAKAGGPAFETGEDAVLIRSFFCPGCAVILDTETAMLGDPPLLDRLTGAK